tara:strand:+ start:187 stop:1023 length:837 start_codon:yes stop_codon:yes gene_type:complete
MEDEKPISEEIILKPDGYFYKRKSVTTMLMHQTEAIQSVKAKPVYHVNPVAYTFVSDILGTIKSTYYSAYAGATDSNVFYFTTRIPCFPFPGASLQSNRDENDNIYYTLFMQQNMRFPTPPNGGVCGNTLETFVSYVPQEHEQLFVTSQYTLKNGEIRAQDPMLFLYDPITEKSYHLNLPNVFSGRGHICTGNEYPKHTDKSLSLKLHKNQLESLFTSIANNDLRETELEQEYLSFQADGTNNRRRGPDEGSKRFYQEVTNEHILDFTTHLTNERLFS